MAEATEEQDSQPVEEVVQETETQTDSSGDEDLAEKNKQLYERAKKAEAKVKELEKNKSGNSSTNSPVTREDYERLELRTEGYKGEEIDFIMRNGGKGALDDKLVMAAIESQRKAVKSQNATPSGTGKSAVYQKYTERDLKNMPTEELEKIIPQE